MRKYMNAGEVMDRRYERNQITPPFAGKRIIGDPLNIHDLQDFTGIGIEQAKAGVRGPTLADYSNYRHTLLTGGVIGQIGLLQGRQKQTLIQVVGPDEIAEVISFALIAPFVHNGQDNSQLGIDVDCYAEIEFGIGGVSSSFELDFTRGQVVSLPASYLQINAVNATDNAATLQFGAMVSLKPLGLNVSPRRTVKVTVDAGATSAAFSIPRYAQRVMIQRPFSATGSPFAVRWYGGDSDTGVIHASNNVGSFQTMDLTMIDGNSLFFTIVNNNAPGPTDEPFYAIFELAV